MELRHSFTVPLDVESTWAHFGDIAALAECFPGAVVTDVAGDTFRGTVKVKLGPIALQYAGSGTFVEKDDAAHRFVVEAKGKDKRGNGTAGATVTLAMTGAGGSTEVQVDTDLAITGKPAQFGRGVMQDVSDKLLGQFDLVGIPPAARGVPQIEVTFDIDANGIVSVQAKDKGTGKEQKITIQASGGLSDDDIEKMVKEAEENAEADKARKELVEAKNQAESLIHSTEKSLEEHGEKVDPTTVEAIELAVAALKDELESENAEKIKSGIQNVMEASMKLGEAIYKSSQEEAGEEPAPEADGPANDDDTIVDADFEDLDDDKRA